MVIRYGVMLPESERLGKLVVRKSAKTDCKGWIYSKWSPWSAGCGSCGAKWCFVRCLQFGQNLEELAHGVSPGHTDILVLEHEEIAIPRLRMYPPKFM